MAATTGSLTWQVNTLSPLTLHGRRLDERDLESPDAKQLKMKVKELYERVLNHPRSLAFLEKFDKIDFSIDISAEKGITLLVKKAGFAWDNPLIKPHEHQLFGADALTTVPEAQAIMSLASQALQLVGKKGVTVAPVSEAVERLKNNNHPILAQFVAFLEKMGNEWFVKVILDLLDINAINADGLSMIRNTSTAVTDGKWAAIPLMAKMGGIFAMITGSWFALKAIVNGVVSAYNGDWQGALFGGLLSFFANVGYIGMGVVMFGSMLVLEKFVGFMFYGWFGLCAIVQTVKDAIFRHQLNKKIESGDLAATLEWMQKKAQENPDEFARKTSGPAAHRILHEVDAAFLQKLKDKDPDAIKQAAYLIEEVAKASTQNLFTDILYVVISIFGIISSIPGIDLVASAVLFAVGAFLWLFSGDLKLGHLVNFNLKEWVINKCWDGDSFRKKLEELQIKGCAPTTQQSLTSSTISGQSGVSPQTA